MSQLANATETARALCSNVSQVLIVKQQTIEFCLVALIARGHLLIEDVPGLGKTALAKALAVSTGCTFKRIQFVPDLLPGDITGVNIFNQRLEEFQFRPGPIMAQVVLGHEINRAPAKTQAALLEAMEEYQTTVDGVTYPLPRPFFVIATQNPSEHHGTSSLPETQLDRFMMRVNLGYASQEEKLAILARQERDHPLDNLAAVATPEEVTFLQEMVKDVYVDPLIRQYIVTLVQTTRRHQDLALGASHRASLALFSRRSGLGTHPGSAVRHPGRCEGACRRGPGAPAHPQRRGRCPRSRQRAHRAGAPRGAPGAGTSHIDPLSTSPRNLCRLQNRRHNA